MSCMLEIDIFGNYILIQYTHKIVWVFLGVIIEGLGVQMTPG